MKKRIFSFLLACVMLLGMLPVSAFAASSETEALGEVDIINGGTEMSYLSINGRIRTQIYTYYNFDNGTGRIREIPAYCVNPNTAGVPQTVAPGESIEYLADEKASDPKVMGIVANGYPTRGLGELKLENKYHAYYATKMALWCYILPNWNINDLKVNPNLTGVELQRAQAILAAAKDIYARGTAWNEILAPEVTCTPDRDAAYDVTIDGKAYKQQVFTFWSKTWVCDYAVSVAFTDPDSVPAGTRIVDMNNRDITTITTSGTGNGYAGKFKVLYPADAVEGESGSAQLSFGTNVYKYAVFYAVCAETGKYGEIQNYMVDTDPTTTMQLSAFSNYAGGPSVPEDVPDTGLRILKYETGTELPLSGARFEVIGPDGDTVGIFATNGNGEILIPLLLSGNYTVIERDPPAYHLLSDEPTQNVTVRYGEVAEVTYYNSPYGNLTVEKRSNSGMSLPGAVITIQHIESGKTYTAETNFSGRAIFTEIQPGAYRVQEISAPSGWQLDDTVYTITVVAGETATIPIINEELPGLRIIKYDRKNQVAMPGVTFEIFKDTVSLGKFRTDEFGEILLTDLEPGTYLAYEVDTGSNGHILDTTPQQVELKAGDGIKELLFFNDVKPGLRLVKVDSTDPSKVIPNAVFEIKSVAGDYGPQEFTTDENGEIDLSELPAGAYVVTEKSCPGYVIDQAQRIIQLDPNEDAHFVFTNSIKPSLQLIKTSADGSRLAGVTFRIAKIQDGSHYLDRTTNAQGEILIADLEPGVYSVKEIATVTDHIIDSREHHVELFPGRTSTIVLQNDKRPNLTVYKHDADTGEPVPNTVFLVRAADGHSVDEIKTDSTGKATLTNLLPGVYEISEKSVPAPYLQDADPQLVTLYPNRDHTVYFKNHKKPSLTVNKVDSITGSPIKGAKFEVWYGSNNTTTGELNSLGTFYSDENGQFFIDSLRDGWYKVTELEPAPGFTIKEPATQEVYIKGGESKVLTFQNVPKNAIVVEKYDSITGEALPGCTFQLKYLGGTSGTGGTVIGTKVTGKNGTAIWTGLNPGAYVLEEIDPADGYNIVQASETIMLADSGEQSVITVRFKNAPDGILLIRKVCATNPSMPLQNAEFKVAYADGSLIGDSNGIYRTDEAGEIRITGLKPGKSVVVTETRAPDGFILDTQSQTIQIKEGKTVSLTFKNQPKGALIIQKRDSQTNEPLSGAEFRITTAAGCEVGLDGVIGTSTLTQNGIFVTDAQGEIRISNLAPGAYVINEIKAPDGGYVIDTPSTNVVIGQGGDTQTVIIKNTRKGGLIVEKYDSVTKQPLSGAQFKIMNANGELTPDNEGMTSSNGLYTTNAEGQIILSKLLPGTYVVTEVRSPDHYQGDPTPQTVVVNAGDTQTLRFYNDPLCTLTIQKYVDGTTDPIQGVTFLVTDSSGQVLGPNNGEYITDKNGRIVLTGLVPGTTITAKETKTADGYVLDTTPQSILIKQGEAQTMTFFNKAEGGLELIKVSESNKAQRIPNTTFEIRRMDGGLVDTVTTDKNGRVHVNLDAGDYYAVEIEAAEGFKLDNTPHYFTIQDGKTTTLTVSNAPFSGIIIHKVDSVTGEGIYDVKFLVYDQNKNPIGEYATDDEGYIYIDDLTVQGKGKLFIRELEAAPGYELDKEYKTVYVQPGKTVEIEWENTPITGQFQIHKYAAEYNEVTGTPAGAPLQGAVYEISEARSGKVVDYITTDARGVAASRPLPLGRYKIVEVTAPAYWQVSGTVFDETLEYSGQIIKLSDYDKPSDLGVTITKRGNAEALAGSQMRYDFTVANTSNVPLENFYWHDRIPTDAARATVFTTGTYSARLNYRILYKTNYSATYQVLASNLLTSSSYSFSLNAIPTQAGEYVTDVYLDFGKVPVGFQSTSSPTLTVQILGTVANGYQIINRADVGGKYQGTWQTAQASWVTIVRKLTPNPTLPKTGYVRLVPEQSA